ncbi:unnamed protein product [Rhodiola kirilowii]
MTFLLYFSGDLAFAMNSFGRTYQDPGDIYFCPENGSESYGCGDSVRTGTHSNGKPADSCQAKDEVNFGKGCNATHNMKLPHLTDKNFGLIICDPPQAEDSDDDMEVSVSNIDEDDDETVWGQQSSLSSFRREGSGIFKFKEEKVSAMEEVVNGKLKTIVYELLRIYGVTSSGEDSEIWTDIITSLSWEAASFVKVDPADSKAMDPDGYVKVKCVATGSRNQSQLIKGLVFKKNASHKHMPTMHSNPRLLLIRGAIDQSLSKLSSFDSMKQEENHIESVIEKLAAYRPNVILVEKSTARFVQEFFLAKGMTLILDMKLHRLQRIARCTGSPIISPDDVQNQTLKHCESFHLEKFIEEHAVVGEGGKKPSKTLMFLEGLPTRFGCTIVLKGASNDELKRIKSVVKYSVVMAYHLILETSFLVDQRVMFSSISSLEESPERNPSATVKDIPISHGFGKEQPYNFNFGFKLESDSSFEPYNPAILTGLSSISASVNQVVEDRFPLAPNSGTTKSKVDSRIPVTDSEISSQDVLNLGEMSGSISTDFEISSETNVNHKKDADAQSERCTSTLLDTEGILVMMSIRNASKGTICEQIHYTHIRFYKDLDVPLGKYFRERLFNQSGTCSTCSELPGDHFHYYAYRNKQLTVRVQRIPDAKCLPGEREGKLWMWSRCGKCYVINDIPKSTNRVPVSAAARDLSFGKFLELTFSQYSTSSAVGRCGHFLHRDFLHFFGIGKMVAMFSFSKVATYTVVRPPQMLIFKKSIKREKLIDEIEKVHTKGMLLFREIENHLQKMAPALKGLSLRLRDSVKEFADVEKLLSNEKSECEEKIQRLFDDSPYQSVQKFLKLNLFQWELLLESCIWEKRLHDLLSIDPATIGTKTIKQTLQSNLEGCKDMQLDESFSMKLSSPDDEISVTEIPIEGNGSSDGELAQLCDQQVDGNLAEESSNETEKPDKLSSEMVLDTVILSDTETSCLASSCSKNLGKEQSALCGDLSVDRDILIAPENVASSSNSLHTFESRDAFESSNQWIWTPFSDLRQEFVNDLQAGHLPIFEPNFSSTPELLPTGYQLITEEGQKLHIPLDKDIMLTYHEGELSSIIACALALLKDHQIPLDHVDEDNRKHKFPKNDSFQNLGHMGSFTSSSWSSTSSLRSDGSHSTSFSFDESRLSSFNGLDLLDSLLSLEALHPEIPLGATKFGGKNKYSVVCKYAGRFRDLRNRCIPSEDDYISSLSRCTNWNAKGGKSKAVFTKTLDERFIVKEIQRIELESFIKFAPDYFKYMTESFELRNPTCLAKIFGIYQVTIKQKGGKEVKHDLLVMENLTFGRNISKQYDLKGALHDRFNSASDDSGEVFLDQNFVNDMGSSPFYVSRTEKHRLERALWNDTVFLNSIQVMDYSLLVGIDAEKKELVCGIIDYLRQYTWDKQLETWVKSSLVVPKNVMPTIISPVDYKRRFRKFMSTYFLWIPDEWCSEEYSNQR